MQLSPLKLGVSPNLFLSCGFLLFLLFLLSHNLFLLPHDWSDFDLTWSERPVSEWLQKLSTDWPQMSFRGHRGQKGHFHEKCFNSPKLCSRITWLTHINTALYSLQKLSMKGQSEVIWGYRGQKTRSNYKQLQMTKVTVSMCWCWANIHKCPRWPLCPTYG